MKTNITILLLAFCMIVGCTRDNEKNMELDRIIHTEGSSDPCSDIKDIYAGQYTYVGTVTYVYDSIAATLDVTYNMDAGWTLEETHLWVGDCNNLPTNNPGNPIIGQFPYKGNHNNVSTVNYLVENANAADCISAHSVVNGPNGENETGWMEGTVYVSNGSWAMYRPYDFSSCPQ